MKYILGTVAAAMLAGAVFVQPAEARCWWNGFETVCVHHFYPHHWWHHRYWRAW